MQSTAEDHAGIFSYGPQACTGNFFSFSINPPNSLLYIDGWCNGNVAGVSVSDNVWDFVAFTVYNGLNGFLYEANNGGSLIQYPLSFASQESITTIGNVWVGFVPNRESFNGSISDVQVYSFSLTQSQITQIYKEGMGGSPFSGIGLVAWWPLDGNANDYSGNNNNGVPTNVQWVSP